MSKLTIDEIRDHLRDMIVYLGGVGFDTSDFDVAYRDCGVGYIAYINLRAKPQVTPEVHAHLDSKGFQILYTVEYIENPAKDE